MLGEREELEGAQGHRAGSAEPVGRAQHTVLAVFTLVDVGL